MKRKILSLVLVIAMLASMMIFVPAASATESLATLEFGTAAGTPGETVEVDFTITTAQLSGLQFMFEYDASRLTYDSISWTTAYGTTYPKDLSMNPVFVQFTQNGPYIVESMAFDAGAQDFSAGVLATTLTFTIKDDAPLGDAKVAFAYLLDDTNAAVQPNKIEPNTIIGESMTFVDGKVTVLPEGYSSESKAPAVDYITQDEIAYMFLEEGTFVYEPNDDFTGWIITTYAGSFEGIVVFPSEITDVVYETGETLPVVKIATGAVASTVPATGYVIPATVTEIADRAFFKSAATDYYILNSSCVIGSGAIGADGNWSATSSKWLLGPFVMNTAAGAPTIHGVAGSTAEVYAAGPYKTNATHALTAFNWSTNTDLPTENTLTVDGNTYYFLTGATATAPGVAEINGATVIAWTDGTNTYAPGAEIVVTKDIALEPVTITAPQTAVGTDFKITANEADLAMRFTSSMSIADYNKLDDLGTVELGMLITPAKYVSKAGAFTKEALDALNASSGGYVDIAIGGYYNKTDSDYIFAGSLKGFSAATLAKNPDFAAILYATVTTEGGDTFTVYGDFNFEANQDVKSVAEALSTSDDLTETQQGWLATLVGKFTA